MRYETFEEPAYRFVECPICGAHVYVNELRDHLDSHKGETIDDDRRRRFE